MFYLKNDDMEAFFRKAAQNYEVDARDASDWETVHAALHGDRYRIPEGGKKKKRRFIFWWLLLFPAGWIAHNAWDGNFNDRSLKRTDQANHVPLTGWPESRSLQALPAAHEQRKSILQENNSTHKNIYRENVSTLSLVVEPKPQLTRYGDTLGDMQDGAGVTLRGGLLYAPALILQRAGGGKNGLLELTAKKQIMQSAAIENKISRAQEANITGEQTNRLLPPDRSRYFYIQSLVAADLSAVRFQRIPGVGYGAGLMLGYGVNNRWQAEAGALWEKKRYYSRGEYFDKSGLGQYWSNISIYSVNGNCNMITIPVDVHYTFSRRRNSRWFFSAGVSSYLMNREYYDYTYAYSGSVHTRGYTYRENSRTWLATVNLGAGYERQIGKSMQLRAAPYFRAPASGIGKGKLSLSSTGIFIGIGKRFH